MDVQYMCKTAVKFCASGKEFACGWKGRVNPVKVAQRTKRDSPFWSGPKGLSLLVHERNRMQHVTIYSDGSARGNPGPGGYGAVLQFRDAAGELHEKELSQGYACTTNNRMELLGVIVALEALKRPCVVNVVTDSQYVVKAFTDHWVDGWLKRGWKNSQKKPVKKSSMQRNE